MTGQLSDPVMVHQLLTNAASLAHDRVAIWDKGKWYTYGQLDRWSNQTARWLIDLGISRQDRVALLLENSKDYAAAYFGVLKAGAVVVPINTSSTADGLGYCLVHSGARVLITQRRFLKVVRPALGSTGDLDALVVLEPEAAGPLQGPGGCQVADIERIYAQTPDLPTQRSCIDLDLAMIVYTSGSTGRPKGVMLSHLNLMSNTRSVIQYLGLTCDDRILVVLPFYYIYGNSLLLTHVAVGGSLVIENRFAFPQVVLETMLRTQVTGLAGVPSTFAILMEQSDFGSLGLESLRYVTQAGGHMPTGLQRRVAQAIRPASLYVMYGTTEASPRLTYLDPRDLDRKLGSVGKAVPNVEVAVVDDRGRPVPPGVTGQIVARGSNIMVGYWNDPQATAQVLRDGWYHTGDLGRMDPEGYLYITGRAQDMVKVGGHRVSLQELEEALAGLPGIRQAAVVAVPDEVLGQALEAYVEADQGVCGTADEVKGLLAQSLPRFKLPRAVHFCKSLPLDRSGKVLKSRLQAQSMA